MNRIAALLLTVLALLAPAGALRGDSTIWVNSTADTVAVDNVVTLREALLHARRGGIFDDGSVGISCMTEAEWYQMFGDIENCVRIASPTLAGCVHNPVTDGVRYAFMNDCFYNQSGPGMGLNFADVIRFDPAISAIAIPGDFWVFRRDRQKGFLDDRSAPISWRDGAMGYRHDGSSRLYRQGRLVNLRAGGTHDVATW